MNNVNVRLPVCRDYPRQYYNNSARKVDGMYPSMRGLLGNLNFTCIMSALPDPALVVGKGRKLEG
jgi:hypothetical protein